MVPGYKILFAKVFALDICAYAVMSSHHHVVLHVDREQAEVWTDVKVIEHWNVSLLVIR